MMNEAQIIRNKSTNHGTPGFFYSEDYTCKILELPWRDNKPSMSCIPAGDYIVEPYTSQKFGECYIVKDVQGRTYILFHSGNFAGDSTLGFKTDSLGCILPGLEFGELSGQKVVLSSKKALQALKNAMGYKPFKLKIIWQEDI